MRKPRQGVPREDGQARSASQEELVQRTAVPGQKQAQKLVGQEQTQEPTQEEKAQSQAEKEQRQAEMRSRKPVRLALVPGPRRRRQLQ